MDWIVFAPLMVPLITAIGCVLIQNSVVKRKAWSLFGTILYVIAAVLMVLKVDQEGILVAQAGSWPAPFGITFVADHLSSIMVLISAAMSLGITVYSIADIDKRHSFLGFHFLYHMLIFGATGAFLTGDLFNLYVWYEVMMISSLGLLVIGGSRQQLVGTVQFVALNLIATILFLSGLAFLYGATGTLNMAHLHLQTQALENPALLNGIGILFLIGFGIKSAVFPFFFWLPPSYPTPPVAVSAIFSVLSTKVGVYSLFRVFTLIFRPEDAYIHDVILWISGFTTLIGVLGAVSQMGFRKILSFHVISQVGYFILGLGLLSPVLVTEESKDLDILYPLAVAGGIFYMVHHITVKTNLFLVSGVVNQLKGSFHLKHLGGIYKSKRLLAFCFLISAFSLSGFPPLSGFWAKLILIQAAMGLGSYLLVGVIILTTILTIFSMAKVWNEVFWKAEPQVDGNPAPPMNHLKYGQQFCLMFPICMFALLTLAIGHYPEPLLKWSLIASNELLNPQPYLEAVLKNFPGAML